MIILTPKACAASVPERAKRNGPQSIIKRTVSSSHRHGSLQRIKEMFKKVELSVSPYDTAWVAMVPSPNFPKRPCFPECLNWLLENQFDDGSWAVPPGSHLMMKDSMLSTLTCVVALSIWEMGDEHVRKGLDFMRINFSSVLDNKQLSPTGFDIIFPGMIEYAKDLGLRLPLSTKCFDEILYKRDLELERVSTCNSEVRNAYLAYVSEGLTKSYDWKESMRYQRRNGSLFNSPSSTASILTHHHDQKCFEYLQSVLKEFGNAVPTVYPLNVYIRLRMIDRLKTMGIDGHFKNEIEHALNEIYRCWLEKEEEIFLETETCALAFRLLRTNGYEVSSHALEQNNREQFFLGSRELNLKEIYSILELYKASKVAAPEELVSEELHSWTRRFLKQELSDRGIPDRNCHKEVDEALSFACNTSLERLENRKSIESFIEEDIRILKVKYSSTNIANRDFLELGVEDYNFCQGIHQNELKNLERWMTENRLDKIKFVRHKLMYTHFFISSMLGTPELSDARIAWTKNIVMITMVDDLFDAGGSKEELLNLIELINRWDGNKDSDYCSEQVKVLFLAIWKTINELGSIAFTRQGRNVTSHMIDTWLAMLKGMMFEYECGKDRSNVPTLDEYMEHAHNSIGAGPSVLIALYFLGPQVSAEVVNSGEYTALYKHTGFCCRLLNDLQTYKREAAQGKLNSVLLCMIHGGGSLSEEEAVGKIESLMNCNQRCLLSIVRNPLPTTVPRACKDLFWKAVRVAHYMYNNNDGFNSPMGMIKDLNAVFYQRLEVPA